MFRESSFEINQHAYRDTCLEKNIDSIYSKEPGALIICMGDLNETPDKEAVSKTLGAMPYSELNNKNKSSKIKLYNPFYDLAKQGRGTHYFEKEWNVLDQIIISESLLENKKFNLTQNSFGILNKDFVMFTTPRTKERKPNRTYSGTVYHNGYSDHLAIFMKLKL